MLRLYTYNVLQGMDDYGDLCFMTPLVHMVV